NDSEDSSDSEESDTGEESADSEQKPIPRVNTLKKDKTNNKIDIFKKEQDSSSSDSDTSESEDESLVKNSSKRKIDGSISTPIKKSKSENGRNNRQDLSSSDSSESEDDSDEEETNRLKQNSSKGKMDGSTSTPIKTSKSENGKSNGQDLGDSDSSASESEDASSEEETTKSENGKNNGQDLNSSDSKESTSTPVKKPKVNDDTSSGNTVFVGRLSYNVDADWLHNEMKDAGEIVDIRIVYDKVTGMSKGFGYIEFANSEAAKNALKFEGKEIDGRSIHLDLASPKNGPQRSMSEVSDTLFVGFRPFPVQRILEGK
ncbi:17358_t:CDS:2, partial [Dentiscutata heterogama]